MKTIAICISVLVLTAMLMTGCGCRNSKPLDTMPSENTAATTMPTTEATTVPTTQPTTAPTRETTVPTTDNGNGPLSTEDANPNEGTTGIDGTAKNRRIPGMN